MQRVEPKSILRIHEVCERIGVKRTTIWKWCKAGIFPAPVQLGPRAVGWRVKAVDDWVENLPPTPSNTSES